MPKTALLISIIILAVVVARARNIGWDVEKPPRVSLPAAYVQAVAALPKDGWTYHCVRASLEWALSPDGEWLFSFYAPDKTHHWVTVEFDGRTHVEERLSR